MLLVYVVIAAVNSLVTYALGRRREFAVLRLSGITRRLGTTALPVRRALRTRPVDAVGLREWCGTRRGVDVLLSRIEIDVERAGQRGSVGR